MKRKSPDTSWRENLTEEGIKYLENHRQSKLESIEDGRERQGERSLKRVVAAMSKGRPQGMVDSDVMRLMQEMVEAEVPALSALWDAISSALEASGPIGRKGISFQLALLVGLFWRELLDIRKKRFGARELSDRDILSVVGKALEAIGRPLKMGRLEMPTKGKINVELVSVIRTIRKYERSRLSYRELKAALEYLLLHPGSEDQLRLFVFRAERKGWL